MAEIPQKPWTKSTEEIQQQLDVSQKEGLNNSEVERRRDDYGANRLKEAKTRSKWDILIEQFKNLIIGLLAVAAIVSFIVGEWIEGIAILIAILINAAIGFFTEVKAVQSMKSLQELSKTKAHVRRDGQVEEIPAEEVVPGDIVVLSSGELIPADLRLIESSKLQINESSLTGESVPVSKSTEPVAEDASLADRKNMLYKGTALTRGNGEGVVVAIGMQTELGNISEMAQEAEEEKTPLEQRLDKLGRRLVWVTLGIVAVVAIAGILGGKDLFLMLETAIALAVAAIPEGLPIVATVALARGMWRMAKRNALINQLSAVETLGTTSVICTDKTGTLTENRMTVTKIILPSGEIEVTGESLEPKGEFKQNESKIDPNDQPILGDLLEVGVLCNNAALQPENSNESRVVGDPMEVALLIAGGKAGRDRDALLEKMPEAREVAFDPETKMMATFNEIDGQYRVAVKGAPEAVLEACSHIKTEDGEEEMDGDRTQQWKDRSNDLAAQGLRILALAEKTASATDTDPYCNLTLLGIVGLLDPPRQDVRDALNECHDAGIRVIMVTGDQPVTARNVGISVGLTDDENADVVRGKELKNAEELSDEERRRMVEAPIFARVSPEQKLNLITLHQQNNAVVAMTGDGVNDAPALKKADIGVAMGARGTQVAKEASDMVLQDDAFASIVAAVEQGRAIFNNIRKFTLYLLSGNVGEIIAVGAASIVNAPLPLLPLQILYLNAINDVFPALALGVGEGEPALMERPPRNPQAGILTKRYWWAISAYGVLIAATTVGAFAIAWYSPNIEVQQLDPSQQGMEANKAITISFLTLAFGRLWHVFNMRDNSSGLFRNEITKNPYIWGALLISIGLLLCAVYVPGLSDVLKTVPPGLNGWIVILGMSFVPLVIGQIAKVIIGDRGQKKSSQQSG